jgi:uncharacterized protein
MSENKHNIDPGALGLLGLAVVTLVASSQKLGITSGYSLLLPWSIFLGSFAQLIAGKLDFQIGNSHGGTAFTAYGLFWLAVPFGWLVQMGIFGDVFSRQQDSNQLALAYLSYLIFTIYMGIGALPVHKLLVYIYLCIVFLFLGLTMTALNVMPELFHLVAGISELLVAILGFYGSAAIIINNQYKRVILPVGKPFIKL